MLTDGQRRTGVINPARRWPNNEDTDAYSEYCSTKLQIDLRGVEGIFRAL
jgi:hypothetical protein